MSMDKNAFCPCGSGKKIKFCCKDIAKTLEKIVRSVEGKQYEAALTQINRALEEHPKRDAIWAIKTTVLIQTGRLDDALHFVGEFLDFAPENPIALASSAMLKIATMQPPHEDDDPDAAQVAQDSIVQSAVATLHKALAHCPNEMPVQVFETIGIVGRFLVDCGFMLAGRQHLMHQYKVSPDEAQVAAQLLIESSRSRDVPLLFKQESFLPPPADWVTWKKEYAEARRLGQRGAWSVAAEKIESLIEAHEPHPVLVRAFAVLCCRLPDEQRAAEALRAVAKCKDVTEDEAVEAEALAMLLDGDRGETVDLVLATFTVKDADTALEKLQSDRRAESLRIDFNAIAEDGSPPPKSGFLLLDREMPTDGKQLTIDSVPRSFSECLLYGKQTDKPARVEMICSRPKLEEATPVLKELLGDQIEADAEEKVIGSLPATTEKMSVKPMFPRDTPRDFQLQYVRDLERKLLLSVWPTLPQSNLNGKTPKEASQDPELQYQLKGAVLGLEARGGFSTPEDDIQTLRKELGLEKPEPLKLESEEIRRLPLVRFHRIDASATKTEDLSLCWIRASQNGMSSVVVELGQELIQREDIDGGFNKAEVYGRMAQHTQDSDQAIEWLQKAQQEAIASDQSPAAWMISEMTYRLLAGQGEEAQALLNNVQANHIEEPGVAQMLMQTLQQLGLVNPQGMPPGAAGPGAGGMPPGPAPVGAAAGQGQQTDGGIWTPDGGSAPQPSKPASGEGKSAIWTPGME